MKQKLYTFLLALAALAISSLTHTVQAQTVNENRYIILTVKPDEIISFTFAGDAENTGVRIESGTASQTLTVGLGWNWGFSFRSQTSTITIYGNIKWFKCSYNNSKLFDIDVSNNSGLTRLDCSINDLTTLDVSKNLALTDLDCSFNKLTALDVSKNTELSLLKCGVNNFTVLDVSKNTALSFLSCVATKIKSLDLSKNIALSYLACSKNDFILDISKNTALENLSCSYNNLTSLDISNNTALRILMCYNNNLTSLDVSNNPELEVISCANNKLSNLDISKNTKLEGLYCGNNALTSLDLTKNTALTNLHCEGNRLTALDVSNHTKLIRLICSNNNLGTLDISKNSELIFLNCDSTNLSHLDVSKNKVLQGLRCGSNKLSSLNASKNKALIHLYCDNNELTYLNVANGNNVNFKGSFEYHCFDATGNPNLKTIYIDQGFTPPTSPIEKEWKKDATATYVEAGSFPLIIGGVQITSDNANNIVGQGISGKISYEAATNTLTLEDATITSEYGIGSLVENLTIQLKGVNTIKASNSEGLKLTKNTTITGPASAKLTAIGARRMSGISVEGLSSLTISGGCTVEAVGAAGISGGNTLTIDSSTLQARSNGVGSVVQFDNLVLKDAIIKSPVGAKFDTTKKAVVDASGNIIETMVIIVPDTSVTKYGLIVGGVEVTSANAANITGQSIIGKVSYDPNSKTLTLDNATIIGSNNGIENMIAGLTIQLKGTNEIKGGCVNGLKSYENIAISGPESSKLLIGVEEYAICIAGQSNLTISDGCTVEAFGKWGVAGLADPNGSQQSLTIDGSMLRARGTEGGSVVQISSLELKGGAVMFSSEGAKYDAAKKAVVDASGNIVKDEIVVRLLGTGLETLSSQGIQVQGTKSAILISMDSEVHKYASIYNLTGSLIRVAELKGKETTIGNLLPGIYIVRIGNAAEKVVVQ